MPVDDDSIKYKELCQAPGQYIPRYVEHGQSTAASGTTKFIQASPSPGGKYIEQQPGPERK